MPDIAAPSARIFWDEAIDTSVLPTIARPSGKTASAFDVLSWKRYAVVLLDLAGEHLTLSDGMSRIALRIVEGTLLDGPADLRFVIHDRRASSQLRTLARFRALRQRGVFGAWLHRPEPRARRWLMQLRLLDALGAGASEREIAGVLFGRRRAQDDWRDRDGSLRSALRRLIAAARHNVAGGYRDLLRRE